MRNSRIQDISFYLPSRQLENCDLERLFPGMRASQIEKKLGITVRRIAGENETATDLAVAAAVQLLECHDRSQIDYVIFCTQSPDYKLPASACLIQERLGLGTHAGAVDINQGCSGYIYGLSLAQGLIASEAANQVLLLTGETYSKYLHPEDRGNRAIFGDGASATLLTASEEEGVGRFVFGTDGKGWDQLVLMNGGSRHPQAPEDDQQSWLFMNGPEIFNFTIRMVPLLCKETLVRNHLETGEIKAVLFHQANAFMLNHLKNICSIPDEKFIIDMQGTGNTVSSSIPIVLSKRLSDGSFVQGDKILLAGFGVGYSWAGVVITV